MTKDHDWKSYLTKDHDWMESLEDRLLRPRIPWRTFTMAELEKVAAAAYLHGDTKLLTAARRAIRVRENDPRPSPPDSGWKR